MGERELYTERISCFVRCFHPETPSSRKCTTKVDPPRGECSRCGEARHVAHVASAHLQRPVADTQPLGEAPAALHSRHNAGLYNAGSPPLSRPPLEVRPRRAEPPPPPPLLQEAPTLVTRGGRVTVTEVGEELEEEEEDEDEDPPLEEEEGKLEPPPPDVRLPEAEEPAAPTEDVRTSLADRSWRRASTESWRTRRGWTHRVAGWAHGVAGCAHGVAALGAWSCSPVYYGPCTRDYSGLQPWIPPVTEHRLSLAADVGLAACGQPGHVDQARL
eukprot:scaffold31724_cov59-Phaeocystis_antarctica.AAC.10